MEFYYKALDKEGHIKEGTKNSESELELQKELKAEGINLLSAEPISKFSLRALWVKASNMGTVSTHEKIILNRNLSSMLAAGLSLSRALGVIRKQTRNPKLKKIVTYITSEVKKGAPLSEAMSHFPKVFPPLTVSMVESGEESGNLVEALDVVSEQMEKSYTLQRKIKGAMVYPGVIVFAMTIIGIFMLIYVVPTLTGTFSELDIELPASTRFIIGLSDFIQNNFVIVIVAALAAGLGVYFGLQTRLGKRGRDWALLHTPIIAPLVKEINSARTTRTLASLLSAGVPFVRALQIVQEVVQNSYYKEVLIKAEKNIQLGKSISSVFSEADKLYPIFVSEMMTVGEETGDLGNMLLKVAIFYEEEVEQKTKNMSTIIEPFLMIVVGAIVGFFALSMITPMYSLTEAI